MVFVNINALWINKQIIMFLLTLRKNKKNSFTLKQIFM